jgi:hypothetical protein
MRTPLAQVVLLLASAITFYLMCCEPTPKPVSFGFDNPLSCDGIGRTTTAACERYQQLIKARSRTP